MKITFASMNADLPDGWMDESTISYSKPPDASLAPRMSLNPQSQRPTANVTISWETAPKDLGPATYLAHRIEQLSKALPGFEHLGQGEKSGVPFVEYAFAGAMQLRQIIFAKVVGSRVVCVTGTALPSVYDGVKAQFAATAMSIS